MYNINYKIQNYGVSKMFVKYADYEQQGSFFGELKCAITSENFERFKKKYGEERALGYLQAIRDFTNEFCIMQNTVENKRHTKAHGYPVGPAPSQRALTDFREHNLIFLSNLDSSNNEVQDNKISNSPVI